MPKTFAYQLGEVRGTERARRDYLRGCHETTNLERAATTSAKSAQYAEEDPRHDQYVAGFRAAWTAWFDSPSFLYGAPIAPSVIVTEAALRTALAAALPDVVVLGFHDTLARFLIDHVTTTD